MSSIAIRRATLDDAEAIAGLLSELGWPTRPEHVHERFERLSAVDEAFVAVDGRAIVGLITLHTMQVLHRARPDGRITALVVTASSRGRGVGRALVEHAERTFFEAGCGRIELTSANHLKEAHAFYKHLGYAQRSRRFVKMR